MTWLSPTTPAASSPTKTRASVKGLRRLSRPMELPVTADTAPPRCVSCPPSVSAQGRVDSYLVDPTRPLLPSAGITRRRRAGAVRVIDRSSAAVAQQPSL